jgi:uncharacterized membrane protein YeaQ/YmgE (transglycosylase-associated protein family)
MFESKPIQYNVRNMKMNLAAIMLEPGGIFAWIVAGLIGGWLAGKMMRGSGYGIFGDVALGLVGALVGGFVAGMFMQAAAGFWGTIVVAFLGACALVAIVRAMTGTHRAV